MPIESLRTSVNTDWTSLDQKDEQTRSNEYLKKHGKPLCEATNSIYACSLTSLKPVDDPLPVITKNQNPNQHSLSNWIKNFFRNFSERWHQKSAPIEDLRPSAKLNQNKSHQLSVEKSVQVSKKQAKGPSDNSNQSNNLKQPKENKNVFEKTWDWLKDKWNSLLEWIGIRKATPKSIERDRSRTAKPIERNSPSEIDEDFKYLDITAMDPLRAMMILLVKQGDLRQEEAAVIYQRVLNMQQSLKDIQDDRMKIHAEIALVGKRSGLIGKVDVALNAAQIIAAVTSSAMVVATAATIATGGAAAPLLVVTAVFNGVVHGAKAFNAWLKGDTKEKTDKLKAEMLQKNAEREDCQFQIKLHVDDVKNALTSLTGLSDIGSSLLATQYGK
ncbi:MAG: hypothetical protein BGO14_06230 [Chlamydiales bacterium 38-26]|nr:hypothetical protein [Chlamydiales bacterium]OJV08486.1 MAG: hypothetical protein BGO14_06230 [Chlamydiales bacterium 38-26]